MTEKKCICGHAQSLHMRYAKGGHNRHGSPWVCTKDKCTMWQDRDIDVPATKPAERISK